MENAVLGKYLHTSCVKIIDTATFPTNRLRAWVESGNPEKIAQIPSTTLLREFLKICLQNTVAYRGSCKILAAHQYYSFVVILNIFIMLNVVATLTGTSYTTAEKESRVLVLGLLWVIPLVGSHTLAFKQQFWGVLGSLKLQFNVLLLRKFLNYTDEARDRVATETLLLAMTRDVTDSVSKGFIEAVNLVGTLSRVVLLISAMIFLEVSSGGGVNFGTLGAVLALPLLITLFLAYRQKKLFALRAIQKDAENMEVNDVLKTVLNYRLVVDYDRRERMLNEFRDEIKAGNRATTSFNATYVNSLYFVPWVTTLLVGGFIALGGAMVIAGTLSLEQFLATIALFRSIGAEVQQSNKGK